MRRNSVNSTWFMPTANPNQLQDEMAPLLFPCSEVISWKSELSSEGRPLSLTGHSGMEKDGMDVDSFPFKISGRKRDRRSVPAYGSSHSKFEK
jgi:hypothetical protein